MLCAQIEDEIAGDDAPIDDGDEEEHSRLDDMFDAEVGY